MPESAQDAVRARSGVGMYDGWWERLQAELDAALDVVRSSQEQFHGPLYWVR